MPEGSARNRPYRLDTSDLSTQQRDKIKRDYGFDAEPNKMYSASERSVINEVRKQGTAPDTSEADALAEEQRALVEEQRSWLKYQREQFEAQKAEAQAEKDAIQAERDEAAAADQERLDARTRRKIALTKTGSSGDLSTASTGRRKVLGN